MADEPSTGGLHAHTRAIRAGRADNQNALAPILWATSTFTADSVPEARDLAVDSHSTRFYTRYGNPTVKAFEDVVADLEGTQVIDGSRGTATVQRSVEGDRVELRITFDGYVLLLDPRTTVENEIQADGAVSYSRGGGDAGLRVRGADVRLAVLDAEGRNPRNDLAGRFTFDLSGADIAGLAGEAVRNEEGRLEIRPATPAP